MFAGIIKEVGSIKVKKLFGKTMKLEVNCSFNFIKDVILGDSISTNGVCLTVVEKHDASFVADVSPETYYVTNLKNIKINEKVNLEKSLKVGDKIDGHFVYGHVDGTAKIIKKTATSGFTKFVLNIPVSLKKMVFKKASVSIDGISLTIADVVNNFIEIWVVPHTNDNTTLRYKKIGDLVNIELDMLNRIN